MDANPWTYQVMAKEMAREGKIEAVANPDTQAMSDQRNYLWAEVKKKTTYAGAPRAGSFAGVALAAKVGDKWYTSHHGMREHLDRARRSGRDDDRASRPAPRRATSRR